MIMNQAGTSVLVLQSFGMKIKDKRKTIWLSHEFYFAPALLKKIMGRELMVWQNKLHDANIVIQADKQ